MSAFVIYNLHLGYNFAVLLSSWERVSVSLTIQGAFRQFVAQNTNKNTNKGIFPYFHQKR